jgi:hypothetical protein
LHCRLLKAAGFEVATGFEAQEVHDQLHQQFAENGETFKQLEDGRTLSDAQEVHDAGIVNLKAAEPQHERSGLVQDWYRCSEQARERSGGSYTTTATITPRPTSSPPSSTGYENREEIRRSCRREVAAGASGTSNGCSSSNHSRSDQRA